MEHNHSHSHSHTTQITNLTRAFVVGIILNMLFVLIEFGTGFYYNSLALMSDAGHNLSDVASLILALLAFQLAKIKSNNTFTYGYRKTTILVSLLNAVILLTAIGLITWESILRLQNPEVVEGNSVAIVAGIGILVNTITAFMFFKDKDKDLNAKGAYLHLALDALVSLGVVVAGVLMYYTHWYWLDTVISLTIVFIIFFSTWNLLKDSLVLSLDGVPKGIDPEKIKNEIMEIAEVRNIHHLHIWAISTTQNALTAHLVVDETLDLQNFSLIKSRIKHQLEHLNIQHATLELETTQENCKAKDC